MSYQDRLIDLLDRKYNLVVDSPSEDFWLELAGFLDFIRADETFKPYANRELLQFRDWLGEFRTALQTEIEEAIQIRAALISNFPGLNDSYLPKPEITDDVLDIYYKDPYFRSLAFFDEIVERSRKNGATVWSRSGVNNQSDSTEMASLIRLIEEKFADIERDKIPEALFLKFQHLKENHEYLRREFISACRVRPSASLDFLLEIREQINPRPQLYNSISELLSERVDNSIKKIIQPKHSPEDCKPHLRRVYEQLRASVGSHLAHFELIQRYKLRSMVYDRQRLENLIQKAGHQKEDFLTRDLALYLFDNGVSTQYRVKQGVHEFDLLSPSLFAEAKVYAKSDRQYLINGISQLHAYLNGLEADGSQIREVYYVIFRLGGPLYDWPEKIEMNRWTIYPVTIDLAPAQKSGSRQPRTSKITLNEIYQVIPEEER